MCACVVAGSYYYTGNAVFFSYVYCCTNRCLDIKALRSLPLLRAQSALIIHSADCRFPVMLFFVVVCKILNEVYLLKI